MTAAERRMLGAAATQIASWGLLQSLDELTWVAIEIFALLWIASVGVGFAALVTSGRRGPGYSPRTVLFAMLFLLCEVAFMITTT